ncbi:MAG: TolC family protein [Campylobacterales bacterium]|nr:TolC family protein [Campylobacterales bacterium]
MKYILLVMFVLFDTLCAQTLEEILALHKESSFVKSINFYKDSQVAKNSLTDSFEAPRVGLKTAYAQESAEDGFEYAVGFSQTVTSPFSSESKKALKNSLNLALTQETKHELHIVELEITSKYYGACSSKALYEVAQKLQKEQKQVLQALLQAYKVGEISKKQLLFHKFDAVKLEQNILEFQRIYQEEFSDLVRSIGAGELKSLDCNDLNPPQEKIVLKDVLEHGEVKRVEYEKSAALAATNIYDTSVSDLGYELLYEHELQTERYSFMLSIPLGGLSEQKELLRKEAMNRSSAYTHERDALIYSLKQESGRAQELLISLYKEYALLENDLLPMSEELLELAKYAYDEGEGSLMEYLDASRSFKETTIESLEIKKRYYKELFELYKVADMEYGEKICIE